MSLRHLILAVLDQENTLEAENRTGYEITKQFDLMLGFFWKASHQQVYRELGKLEEEGLVQHKPVPQAGKPDRKIYAITGLGRALLRDWLEAPLELPKINDPLLVKLFAGESTSPTVLLGQLQHARDLHQAKLDTYLQIETEHLVGDISAMPDWQKLVYLTLKHGIARERAWLDWAEEAAAVIETTGKG